MLFSELRNAECGAQNAGAGVPPVGRVGGSGGRLACPVQP